MRIFSGKTGTPVIKRRAYPLAALLMVGVKYFLVSAQHLSPFTQFAIDDGLFVHQAYQIINGLWLGDFSNLTLAKGCIYPAFISAVNIIGVPLLTAQFILYVFAAHVIIRALKPILKNPYLQILLFAIILFNPMSSHMFTTRVLRESFYTSVSLMMIAGFLGMFLRMHAKKTVLIYWAVIAGIMLFLHQNTREEGLTFFPVLGLISLFSLFAIVIPGRLFYSSGPAKIGEILRKSLIVILPYAFLVLGNLSIAAVNYHYYGCFIRNDIREGSFPQAYAALTKIKTDTLVKRVPLPLEARLKAYAASPAFAELSPYLDGFDRSNINVPGMNNSDIIGGFLIWDLKRAVSEAGNGATLAETQHFYKQIADEINLAFDQGRLEKKNNLSFSGFSLDMGQFRSVYDEFFRTLAYTVGFENYSPYPAFFKADIEGVKRFEYITNESALFAPVTPDEYQIPSKFKFMILNIIAKIYQWINPVVSVLAVLSFLFISMAVIFGKSRNDMFKLWIVALTFLLLTIIRVLLIAYMEALQWPGAATPQYLSVAYSFLLIFEIISIYMVFLFINSKSWRGVTHIRAA